MSIDKEKICNVLGVFEGKSITKGYVPVNKKGDVLGVSGVTIATGLDLGQQDRKSLADMGIPKPLIEKLAFYLGVKRREAQYALASQPLCLTKEEVARIDACVHDYYIKKSEDLFNARVNALPASKRETLLLFAELPWQVQSVVVSLEYHLGSSGAKKYTDFIVTGELEEAIALLKKQDGFFARRRKEEAKLLCQVVSYE